MAPPRGKRCMSCISNYAFRIVGGVLVVISQDESAYA